MAKETVWFIEPRTTDTNTVILEMKKALGMHDDDFWSEMPYVDGSKQRTAAAWRVTFDIITKVFSDTSRGLKFNLYRQAKGSDVITRWERPTRPDEMKLVLPLIPMAGRIEEALVEIMRISRDNSTARVSYCPDYVALSMMKRRPDDVEQVSRGFKTILTKMLRGSYDEIVLFGDTITSGMERYILFAKMLNIPVYAKTHGTRKALTELLG